MYTFFIFTIGLSSKIIKQKLFAVRTYIKFILFVQKIELSNKN